MSFRESSSPISKNHPSKPEEEEEEEEMERDKCAICLEYISEPCQALPCTHPYDHTCLLSWLKLRGTCPLCNCEVRFTATRNPDTSELVTHPVKPPVEARFAIIAPPLVLTHRASSRPRGFHRRRPRHHAHPDLDCPTEDTALLRRRHVYRMGMRCLHVGSNRISRFRNFTPRMFREDEELQSRAKMWIRRELKVFEWTNQNAEFLLEYIMAIVKTMDVRSATGAAEDMLSDFIGRENAKIFWHEIVAFLRSPFTSLQAFDGFVQYPTPLPIRFDEDGLPAVEQTAGRKRTIDGEGAGTTDARDRPSTYSRESSSHAKASSSPSNIQTLGEQRAPPSIESGIEDMLDSGLERGSGAHYRTRRGRQLPRNYSEERRQHEINGQILGAPARDIPDPQDRGHWRNPPGTRLKRLEPARLSYDSSHS